MAKVLLTSSGYVKNHSGLNDNTYDKMIIPALERAQDISLCEALGECMVEALEDMVDDGSISESANYQYKMLLDKYIQPFLAYQTLAFITLELGQVMGNGGVDVVTDEHRSSLSQDERNQVSSYWQRHADAYLGKMQRWLRKQNVSLFPELKGCGLCSDGATLDSAAKTSIFLGGKRGKLL